MPIDKFYLSNDIRKVPEKSLPSVEDPGTKRIVGQRKNVSKISLIDKLETTAATNKLFQLFNNFMGMTTI